MRPSLQRRRIPIRRSPGRVSFFSFHAIHSDFQALLLHDRQYFLFNRADFNVNQEKIRDGNIKQRCWNRNIYIGDKSDLISCGLNYRNILKVPVKWSHLNFHINMGQRKHRHISFSGILFDISVPETKTLGAG